MVIAENMSDGRAPHHEIAGHPGAPQCGVRRRTWRDRRDGSRAAWFLLCVVLVILTVLTVLGDTATESAPVRTFGTVDLSDVVEPTTPWAIGIGASTYGATVLTSPIQARNEKRLGAAMVRIPVSVRRGVVTSGAVGAGGVPVPQLVLRYLQWGYRVLVVLDASEDTGILRAADVRTVVAALGYGNGVQYSSANEPDNQGRDLEDAVAQARMIVRAGRALFPDFRVWGPVWGRYDRQAFRRFAAELGDDLAGIDYHAYAMGQTSIPTAQALARTPLLGRQIAQTAADLRSLGLHAGVSVDELNLTWRYADGTPGGDTRLLTAVNTVWLASACGHIMLAGGSCLPYANQNGPLGMLTETGQIPRDRQPSTPMPGYWGIAAWSGADLFPHMGDAFLRARVAIPGIEIFAVRNVAAGYNLVVIDKNQSPSTSSFILGIKGARSGRYVPYTTDPARPFEAPVTGPARRYGSTISLVVHAMTVTTLVLSPAA